MTARIHSSAVHLPQVASCLEALVQIQLPVSSHNSSQFIMLQVSQFFLNPIEGPETAMGSCSADFL